MSLFKTKVISPKPGGNVFEPMGVVEAGFRMAYLSNTAEVDSFRSHCIEEIERVCDKLKRGMDTANQRIIRTQMEDGAAKYN